MSEASSGHGGDFELVSDGKEGYKPNLEFTLPIEFKPDTYEGKVKFDGGSLDPHSRTYPIRSLPSEHPNNHPIQPHPSLSTGTVRPNGKFEAFLSGITSAPEERLYYDIRRYTPPTASDTIMVSDLGNSNAIEFNFSFSVDKNTYVVLVVYNFRRHPHPNPQNPPRELIFIEKPSGNNIVLSRRCYVYIVKADNDDIDPQIDRPSKPTLSNANLMINLTQLVKIMDLKNPDRPTSELLKAKLYYAQASEISDANIEDWTIEIEHVADSELDSEDPEQVIFNYAAADFPLGLYIFGEPESSQAAASAAPEETSSEQHRLYMPAISKSEQS